MAHIVYPRVDSQPAGFSRVWINDVLRGHFRFQGLVFSDDLSMEGAACAGDFPSRAFAALEAGCDMVLVCNQREEAARVADALTGHQDPVSQSRMARMHGRHAVDLAALHADPRWEQAVAAVRGYEENPELDLDL